MNKGFMSSRWNRNRILTFLGGCLVAVVALVAWRSNQRAKSLRQIDEAEKQVLANYTTATDHFFARQDITAEQFVEAMETHVLAPWRELEAVERQLRDQQREPKVASLLDRRLAAMKLREQAWGLIVDSIKDGDNEAVSRAVERAAEADRIEAEIAAELAPRGKQTKK